MTRHTHSKILPGVLLLAALAGCGTSPSSRLYMLEPMSVTTTISAGGPTIAIRPIGLPEHLNRKEIVTRNELYRVHAAEFDRWAEPLDDSIAAVLAENLSILVPSENVITYPWDNARDVDFTISVRVLSFAVAADGEVALGATWMISGDGEKPLRRDKTRYSERRYGDEVVATVAAMSRALEQLSRDIAAALSVVLADQSERDAAID